MSAKKWRRLKFNLVRFASRSGENRVALENISKRLVKSRPWPRQKRRGSGAVWHKRVANEIVSRRRRASYLAESW